MNAKTFVTNFENLELGAPWSAMLESAVLQLATERAAADAIVFSTEIQPLTADVIVTYETLTRRTEAMGYDRAMAGYHARAVVSHPLLASCFRTSECLADIRGAAMIGVGPSDERETHFAAGARAASASVERYRIAIAAQLAAVDGHELQGAARSLLGAVTLALRLDAARQCHEQYAAAELERVNAERRAAARGVIAQTVARVREAQAAATDAAAKAAQTAAQYRLARADALSERLKLSGLTDLRTGEHGGIYGVDDLAATVRGMSIESLAKFELALEQAGR